MRKEPYFSVNDQNELWQYLLDNENVPPSYLYDINKAVLVSNQNRLNL